MTRTLILGRDINIASQSTSTGATQRRRRVFTVQEALELLETMGSDVVEDHESSDDDSVVSEADVSASDDDEWQVNNAPGDAVGDESNNDEPAVDQGTEPERGAGGRNSSVGSAWARCPQPRGFDPPLGKFSDRGDFSLGVNMGSNSIPPKTPSDESIN